MDCFIFSSICCVDLVALSAKFDYGRTMCCIYAYLPFIWVSNIWHKPYFHPLNDFVPFSTSFYSLAQPLFLLLYLTSPFFYKKQAKNA